MDTVPQATNGHRQPQAVDTINVRGIVQTLEDLMVKVTQEECNPATVNAACNAAGKITDLLRLHLDAERLKIQQEKRRGL